jgi:hypothetical protein
VTGPSAPTVARCGARTPTSPATGASASRSAWTATTTTTRSLGACNVSSNYTLFVDLPATTPTIINMGSYLTTTVIGTAYQWYLDGNIIPGATANSYTPTQIGWYMLRLNNGACEAFSDYYEVITTTLKNIEIQQGISVGPNPVREQITVGFNTNVDGDIQYEILNSIGQIVQKFSFKADQNSSVNINVQALSAGVYHLSLSIGNTKNTTKFIKQ